MLVDALGVRPLSVDDLVDQLAAPLSSVLTELVQLELLGVVEQREGEYCCRPSAFSPFGATIAFQCSYFVQSSV